MNAIPNRRKGFGALSRRDFLRRGAMAGLGLASAGSMFSARGLSGFSQNRPLTFVLSGDAATMDPHLAFDVTTTHVQIQMLEALVTRAQDGTLAPLLAADWVFENTRNVVFTLREGVVFHNGEPFDAETVKANFDRLLFDPEITPGLRPLFGPIVNVEVLDRLRVRFTMDEPFPLLIARLTNVGMLPQAHLAQSDNDAISSAAVGTGPYEFVAWQRDNQLTMKRNANYWGQQPEIEDVVFRVVPDPSTQLLELLSQNVDVILLTSVLNAPTIASSDVATVRNFPNNITIDPFFNPSGPDSPLQNVAVRQALNLAVNVPELVEALVGPFGSPLATVITPLAFGFNPSVSPFGFDPQGAVQLLKGAGYPDGFSTSMVTFPPGQDGAEIIGGYLQDVGVQVDLRIAGFGEFFQQVNTRSISEEIFLTAWSVPALDAQSTFEILVKTGGVASYYTNEEADVLIDVASKTFDPGVRQAALFRVQEIIKDEPIAIYSHTQDDLAGVSSRLVVDRRPDGKYHIKDWLLQ